MSNQKDLSKDIEVRCTRREDIDSVIEMCRLVYMSSMPWSKEQLESHLKVFGEGQLVAVEKETGKVVGMAASLIVLWDDYDVRDNWRDFTDHGYFTNHDPEGRTLYGAEVMVHPHMQGRGLGKKLYVARRDLVRRLGLLRIRAGARLRGYGKYKEEMTPEEYVLKVVRGELGDPTLSFQMKQGFRVLGVVRDYLHNDEESCGHAALIEWINHEVAQPKDAYGRDRKFAKPRKKKEEGASGG